MTAFDSDGTRSVSSAGGPIADTPAGLSAIPLLLIPYDSITHLLGADLAATSQTLPATALFSIVYLLLRRGRIRTCTEVRRIAYLIGIVFAYVTVATIINIVLEVNLDVMGDATGRLGAAIRQGASFTLGLTTFLMFQDALLRLGWRRAARVCLLGAIPSLLLATAQVLRGDFRVQGFSSEPAHFADYLVFIVLPTALVLTGGVWRRAAGLGGCALALLSTFSSTGFIKAACALGCYFVSRRKAILGLALFLTVGGSAYLVLALIPDNYVATTITSMLDSYGDTGDIGIGTFVDRAYGFWGPLSHVGQGCSILGCGFGSDTVYFYRLFDPEVATIIESVKGSILSIAALQGKALLYAGVAGYCIYALAWWRAWSSSPRWHPAWFMLPTVFVSSFFTLGPFFLPYVWFWIAAGPCAAGETRMERYSERLFPGYTPAALFRPRSRTDLRST